MKSRKVGGISFGSEEAYQKFLSLGKNEQVERVYNSLSPKDRNEAERLLKNVPNGDKDSTGRAESDKKDKAATTGGGGKTGNSKKPASDKS